MFYCSISLISLIQEIRTAYVINCGESAVRPADLAASILKTFKCLWGSYFVDEMSVCDRSAPRQLG